MARDAVFHCTHSSGVRRDIAAEGRGVLAGIDGVNQVVLTSQQIKLVETHARLHHCDMILGINLEHLIHAFKRDHDGLRCRHSST